VQTPPPLCDYIKWVDISQSENDVKDLMRESERRRARTEENWYRAEQEEKRKRFQESLARQKQEEERRAIQAREEERARKRELARKAKAEGEEAHANRLRKGKYPKFP
jgi:hypothetical protein